MRHKRIIVTRYGGSDALDVVEDECPEPKRHEVRVKVLAAGVALPDVMARQGIHPETPKLPFTPGWDLVGLVDRLGEDTTGFSAKGTAAVVELGGTPIDYKAQDFVDEILRRTGDGVDVIFDPIGGAHIWRSRRALRRGGRVIAYGNTTSLRGKGLAAGSAGRRNRLHGIPIYALYIAGGLLLPGRRRVIPYSIQWLKRLRPAMFRHDVAALFDLFEKHQIKPLVARRFPLDEARRAQELLERGGVVGKIVLVP